jgi:integrase
LPPDRYEALRDACGSIDWRLQLAFVIAYRTGMRRGEIIALQWPEVDLKAGVLRIRAATSKSRRRREVPLRGDMRALLELAKTRHAMEAPADCVFVFHRDGKPINAFAEQLFRKQCKKACVAADVPGLLFHDLRRTAVTDMVNVGITEKQAMSISGHQTRAMFDRYNMEAEGSAGEAGCVPEGGERKGEGGREGTGELSRLCPERLKSRLKSPTKGDAK